MPRNVIEWALRKMNVPEGLVQAVIEVIQGYEDKSAG